MHHLPHLLDGATGADQAAEQIGLALPTTITGLVVHFTVDLGAMQRVEQLVITERRLQTGQHAPTQVFRPLGNTDITHRQQGQKLIPPGNLLGQLKGAALGLDIPEQDAEHFSTGTQFGDCRAPVLTGARQMLFPEETQNNRQLVAARSIVIDQQDFGFTPHLVLV